MEKVKVSRKVANAMKELESWIGGDKDRVDKVLKIAELLAYGYEVEQTELDKFYTLYNTHAETSSLYQSRIRYLDESELEQERYSSGFVKGVHAVAKAFGIKIKGVND